MTPSGEFMMRIKSIVVRGPASEVGWRNRRARSLALMIAWHRRHRKSAGESQLRQIVLGDIIPDIGWPKLSWLKRRIREEQAQIAENIAIGASWGAGDE